MKLWKRRWKNLANNKRLLNLVGLTTRARKVVNGEFSAEESVKSGKPRLITISEEASGDTRKKFTNICAYYKASIYPFGTKDEPGHAMGQEFGASPSMEGAGFARSMVERVNIDGGSLSESR